MDRTASKSINKRIFEKWGYPRGYPLPGISMGISPGIPQLGDIPYLSPGISPERIFANTSLSHKVLCLLTILCCKII